MTNKEAQMVTMLELVTTNPETNTQLLSEEEQKEVYARFKAFGEHEVTHKYGRKEEVKTEYLQPDWTYIFAPIKDEEWRTKLIDLFEKLDGEA